jgi:hypothetical protein
MMDNVPRYSYDIDVVAGHKMPLEDTLSETRKSSNFFRMSC